MSLVAVFFFRIGSVVAVAMLLSEILHAQFNRRPRTQPQEIVGTFSWERRLALSLAPGCGWGSNRPRAVVRRADVALVGLVAGYKGRLEEVDGEFPAVRGHVAALSRGPGERPKGLSTRRWQSWSPRLRSAYLRLALLTTSYKSLRAARKLKAARSRAVPGPQSRAISLPDCMQCFSRSISRPLYLAEQPVFLRS